MSRPVMLETATVLSGTAHRSISVTEIVAFIAALLVIAGLFSLWTAVGDRKIARRARGLVAQRPGWTVEQDASLARTRYQQALTWHYKTRKFHWLMAGPLPTGARAEVFQVESLYTSGSASGTRFSTIATVVFPFVLPTVLLGPDDEHPADKRQQPGPPGQPDWRGVKGLAADPEAAAALFTADQLEEVRQHGRAIRMEGHAVVLSIRWHRKPEGMLQLVDEAAALVGRLPAGVLQRAAAQPNPWPGPTAGQPG